MPEFQDAQAAFVAIGNRLVELQGMIEAHRYVLLNTLWMLDATGTTPLLQTVSGLDKAIEEVKGMMNAHPDDGGRQLQHGAAIEELEEIRRSLRGPLPPAFSVIDGGKD